MAIVTDQIELLTDFTDDKKKLTEKLDSLKARPPLGNPRGFGHIIMWPETGAHYSALRPCKSRITTTIKTTTKIR
jgi:hypothetical protein